MSHCAARPSPRFDPWPTISSAFPSASAHWTAPSTSLPSRGLSVSVMKNSKPRNTRKRHAPGVHVHAAQFGTAVQGRKDLAGIQKPLGVERTFEALLLI